MTEKKIILSELSSYIAHNQKEKALNIYKLLVNNFTDKAYVTQTEADILYFFNDINALTKYKQAAMIYKKEKRFFLAESVLNQILVNYKNDLETYRLLLDLYLETEAKEKCNIFFNLLINQTNANILSVESITTILSPFLKNSSGISLIQKKEWFIEIIRSQKNKLPHIVLKQLEAFI